MELPGTHSGSNRIGVSKQKIGIVDGGPPTAGSFAAARTCAGIEAAAVAAHRIWWRGIQVPPMGTKKYSGTRHHAEAGLYDFLGATVFNVRDRACKADTH